MKKHLRTLEYLLYAIFINGFLFILHPLPMAVVSGQIYPIHSSFIWETLSTLVLYLTEIFVIICLLKSVTKLTSDIHVGRIYVRMLLPGLGLRLLADALIMFLPMFLFPYGGTIPIIVEALLLYVLFLITAKKMKISKSRFTVKQRIILIIGALVLMVLLAGHTIYQISSINQVDHLFEKYRMLDVISESTAYDFKQQLIALLFNVVLWFLLILYWQYRSHTQMEERRSEERKSSVLVARVLAILLVVPMCIGAKILVLPQGTMASVNRQDSQVIHVSGEKDLNADYVTTILKRKTGYSGETVVYSATKVRIKYGNDVLLTYHRELASLEERSLSRTVGYSEEGNTITLAEDFTRIEIEGFVASRYDFEALAYMSGDTPNAILTKKINAYGKKDETLICVLETLIEQGYFEAFEYSYQYLLRYDRDFIVPYIRKYASGDLTGEEQGLNGYLRPRYMMDFAQGISY